MAFKIDKRVVEQFAFDLTGLLKDEITKQNLIDTGKMLRETRAKVKLKRSGDFEISIRSTPYYKYVDGNFQITTNAFKGAKYNAILTDIKNYLNILIEKSLA